MTLFPAYFDILQGVKPTKEGFRYLGVSFMRFATRILAFLTIAATASFAQLAPEPQSVDVPLMQDTTGAPMKMDFSLPLSGVSDPGILFSHFAKRNLLIYYFSPKCPHCQKHFPDVQNVMKEYESANVAGIAIAIGGNIKKNDIRMFIDQYKVVIPVFQDGSQKFGPAYGNGYVPVLYLVKPDGTFYRYESLDEAHMNHLRTMLNKIKK